MIEFACPRCGKVLRLKDEAANKKFACPQCRQRVQVPAADPLMRTMKGVINKPSAMLDFAPPGGGWKSVMVVAGFGVIAFGLLGMAYFWPNLRGLVAAQNGDSPVVANKADSSADHPETTKPEAHLSPREIADLCSPAVALIQQRFGSGSGFLVELASKQRVVVTNNHVVQGDLVQNLKVSFPSGSAAGKPTLPTFVFEDRRRDLAILQIDCGQTPLVLATEVGHNGEHVVVIGSPGLFGNEVSENAVTDGLLSNSLRVEGQDYLQISAPINPGNSGGPILNRRGQLVGVAVAQAKDKQNINLAIPLADLRRAMEKASKQTSADQETAAAEHDAVVVFKRMAKATAGYLDGLSQYSASLTEAVQKKEDVNAALATAQNAWGAKTEENNKVQLAPIAAAMNHVVANRALPERLRGKLQDLTDLYTDAQTNFRRPRGTVADITKKTADLKEGFTRLVRGLFNELDLDDLN